VNGTPFKWLNFNELLTRLLQPYNEVLSIKHFTAKVKAYGDPNQPTRQNTYLRALKTIPNLQLVFGQFVSNTKWQPLVTPREGQTHAEVRVTEEKGSELNLASYLLRDAYEDNYDVAVVLSGDSDLVLPLRFVRELGKTVGILYPHRRKKPYALTREANFCKPIRRAVLAASQFPGTLEDADGRIHKPSSW